MEKFEFPSINKIFEHRKQYIPEVGEQLEREQSIEIEVAGEKMVIDYRSISVAEKLNEDADTIVLLPGFGSGREGIVELGFSLACEGRKVILPSLPGYGDSSNPSENYYTTDNFDNEAEVLKQLLEKVAPDKKVHLIGHSMGSEVIATLAERNPEVVSSLTLLNPAGVEESENAVALASRFLVSGAYTNMEANIRYKMSDEDDYQEELSVYTKQASPFADGRIKQRLAEAKKIAHGHLIEKLEKSQCPITYISGELDTVYPPGKELDETSQLTRVINAVNNEEYINTSVMAGLRHNTTIAPDEITAANISHYLDKAEEINKE